MNTIKHSIIAFVALILVAILTYLFTLFYTHDVNAPFSEIDKYLDGGGQGEDEKKISLNDQLEITHTLHKALMKIFQMI
jgi:hypothetical protein